MGCLATYFLIEQLMSDEGVLSYQVLARKYRPQSFDQMIGQPHITQTLLNSLKNDRLPHALLFTGLRGTGKTSSARILAKSIRCTNSLDFVPCNKCQNCIEVSQGNSIDVIEIDGASNNGVDAIRDLRDNVMFMPSSGRYKVFIIDEVHMLSTSAFNALLKTLEEPPAHVIFIMATTEVHKIPQTILSRCQRFDFRRIPIKELSKYLLTLCEKENIQADEKALWMIARQGDGSARDSLSLLDQVINFSSGKLTEANVTQILGLTERSLIYTVFESLAQRQPATVVSALEKISLTAVNPALFLEDMIRTLRHALLLKAAANEEALIDLPQEEIQMVRAVIATVSEADLHMLFDMAVKSLVDVSRASDPLLVLEIALLRMAQAPQIKDLMSLLSSASAASTQESRPPAPKLREELEKSPAPLKNHFEQKPTLQATTAPAPLTAQKPEPQTSAEPSTETWLHFVTFVKKEQPAVGAKLDNLIFKDVVNKRIHAQVPLPFAFVAEQLSQSDTRQKLQGFIDSFFGPGYTFEVVKSKTASGDTAHSVAQQKEAAAENKLKEDWLKDPRIQKAQEVFKANIKVITKD